MPIKIEDYRILVSGLMGTVYIARMTKDPHIMSSNRRKVPKEEFLGAILQYTLSQLRDGSDTMQISIDDKVVAEIVIKDREAIK